MERRSRSCAWRFLLTRSDCFVVLKLQSWKKNPYTHEIIWAHKVTKYLKEWFIYGAIWWPKLKLYKHIADCQVSSVATPRPQKSEIDLDRCSEMTQMCTDELHRKYLCTFSHWPQPWSFILVLQGVYVTGILFSSHLSFGTVELKPVREDWRL